MPETAKFLDVPCAQYAAVANIRRRARLLFDGAEAVKGAGSQILVQGKNEFDEDFQRRLRLATFDPFAEIIIETRQSILHRKPWKVEVPAESQVYLADMDLSGHTEEDCRRMVAEAAQVDGGVWVLANRRGLSKAKRAEIEAAGRDPDKITKADEQRFGIREFIEIVPAEEVIRWWPPTGNLEWLVRRHMVALPATGDEPWMAEQKTRYEWDVWTVEEWITYTEDKDTANSYVVLDRGPHPAGRVPWEYFPGAERAGEVRQGRPVYAGCVSHIEATYNQESDKDHYLYISGHPIPWHTGPMKLEKTDAGKGFFLPMEAGFPQPLADYLETSGAAFQSIMASIIRYGRRIFSMALRKALNDDSRQVASDETQREDRSSLNSSLMHVARAHAAAWKRVWDNIARWRGDKSDRAKVTPNTDFNDETISADFMRALRDWVESHIISRLWARELAKRGEVLPPDYDTKADAAQILREMEDEGRVVGMPGAQLNGADGDIEGLDRAAASASV